MTNSYESSIQQEKVDKNSCVAETWLRWALFSSKTVATQGTKLRHNDSRNYTAFLRINKRNKKLET